MPMNKNGVRATAALALALPSLGCVFETINTYTGIRGVIKGIESTIPNGTSTIEPVNPEDMYPYHYLPYELKEVETIDGEKTLRPVWEFNFDLEPNYPDTGFIVTLNMPFGDGHGCRIDGAVDSIHNGDKFTYEGYESTGGTMKALYTIEGNETEHLYRFGVTDAPQCDIHVPDDVPGSTPEDNEPGNPSQNKWGSFALVN